jgi:hypothetical protein
VIDETIRSTRFHFPDSEIILQMDGIRDEQSQYTPDYDEYKNRVLWKCLHEWQNVLPIVFDKHSHQSTMMKETIHLITTPLLLYIEGDLPLRTDRVIEWQKCFDLFDKGQANTIRFCLREEIPVEHNYLMDGVEDIFIRSVQWSQNPHLSLTRYYRERVLPSIGEKTYIEDQFYGKVLVDCEYKNEAQMEANKNKRTYEIRNWKSHKMFLYYPDNGKDICRVVHLDGRQSTQKFTDDDNHWKFTSIEDAQSILRANGFFEGDK